jgi:RHS repeat-associated protein
MVVLTMNAIRSAQLLVAAAVAITSTPSAADIQYFGSIDDTRAACLADAESMSSQCDPNATTYTAWCADWGAWSVSPGIMAFTRVAQLYETGASGVCYTPTTTLYATFAWRTSSCAAGTVFTGPAASDCLSTTVADKAEQAKPQLGRGVGDASGESCGNFKGNPCDASTGNKLQVEVDYAGGIGIPSFVRSYNSLDLTNRSGFGIGWTHEHDRHLRIERGATPTVTFVRADGRADRFTASGTDWIAPAASRQRLIETPTEWRVEEAGGTMDVFFVDGRLKASIDRLGRTTSYAYNGTVLSSVTGPYGHRITLTPRANGYQVTFPNGFSTFYTTDGQSNLAIVQPQDGANYTTIRSYVFENAALPHALTGIVDELGNRISTYSYDTTTGVATRTEHAGGVRRFDLNYGAAQTTVTDAAGNVETLAYVRSNGVNLLASRLAPDGKALTRAFDSQNRLTSSTDEEGHTRTIAYDSANRPVTLVEASGTPQAVATTIAYVDGFLDLPSSITAPSIRTGQLATTTISYNAKKLPSSITVAGFTPTGATVARTVAITYGDDGQVTSIDGPRTDAADVTTIEYWACNTGGKCGQPRRITNALGHVTNFDTYTSGGLLAQKTDPNGLVTTYAYDYFDRLTSVTETPPAGTGSARTTSFTYNKASKLLTAMLPGGLVLTYAYNTAQDLVSVTDNLGNKVSYAYDVRGNLIQQKFTDAAQVLARQIDLTYDLRNRVATINRGGSITQTVFDAIGNLTSTTDPNGRATSQTYDPLNRVLQITNALGGQTGSAYSSSTGTTPSTVTSPKGGVWEFQLDDLGNELLEVSADRGTQSRSFDAAGNLASHTDARGVTGTRTYDALNRLTGIAYPNAGEDISFTWDTCTRGVGRLCGVTDASGSHGFTYDGFGRLASVVWTTGGQTATTTYAWNPDDTLASITYPSGRVVAFTRNSLGQITSIAAGGQTVVSARAYRADGLLKAQTYGNGLAETRSYDLQGRLTGWTTGSLDSRTYAYDAAGNVTAINGSAYAYDALDRLTTAPGEAFSWDANDNRTGDAGGFYGYLGTSNRLASSPAGAVVLDAAGNTLSIGSRSFAYNQAGRLVTASLAGVPVGQYVYAYDGLRASKTAAGATTRLHYDLEGRLIAESDAAGATLREFVWDDEDRPLAMIAGGTTTFLHADHLCTPRFGTGTGQVIVWQWFDRPFGTGPPTGSVTVNFRYPGQYFDAETGLHQNGYRTFDPSSGRYLESDPIGLAAGINTFGYVGGNPLRFIDPEGLAQGPAVGWITGNYGSGVAEGVVEILKAYNRFFDDWKIPAFVGLGTVQASRSLARVIAQCAPREGQLLLNGPIKITEKGMSHVVERHTAKGIAKFAGKSKFNEGENLSALINSGTQQQMAKQANGNLARTWDAGRLIGIDRVTGRQTSVMTVITRPNGDLVTAFPGRP